MTPAAKAKIKSAGTTFEKALHAEGYLRVAGVDEAGRGPLAGPVCAAVVVFEPGKRIRGVNDSKQLLPEEREELYEKIIERALAVGVGFACAEEIDTINILRATRVAARRALARLPIIPDYLLLDALTLDRCTIPQQAIIKGDSRSFSIAAASIVAKVSRDRLMAKYAEEYPDYGFDRHKGYATPDHRAAIDSHGPCTLHRRTFIEDWFGTQELRYSKSHQQLRSLAEQCRCPDTIHTFSRQMSTFRGFLPKCELRELYDLVHLRIDALNTFGRGADLLPSSSPL